MTTVLGRIVVALMATTGCRATPAPPERAPAPAHEEPTPQVIEAYTSPTDAEHVATAGTATVDGAALRLSACRVYADFGKGQTAELQLSLARECLFATTKAGTAQVVRTDRGPTFLIVSSTPRPGSRFCDTRIRAIVVIPTGLLLSKHEQRIKLCSRGPYDETMFHALAADSGPG